MKSNVKTERRDGQNLRRQSGVGLLGLLLLTLLVANPLQALGQGEISASSTTGADLNSLFGSPTNSVTVDSGVTIDNSTSGNDAVVGATHSWDLTVNEGATLNGNTNGVNLGAGGSVDNEGNTTGGVNGVNINGTTGSVVNNGSIVGSTSDGVHLGAGGSVDNYGGYIEGSENGVNISGGSGSVYNEHTIFGDNHDGVYMGNGGEVDNYDYISGNDYGVEISGGIGSVYNYGSIIGTNHDGVRLRDGGSVENYENIEGNTSGVKITGGSGSVYNYDASITGYTRDGVYMDQGGSVYNEYSGTIYGNEYGVEISGGAGYVTNSDYSSIIGTNHDGVRLRAGGGVDNEYSTIEGHTSGVKITGGPGSVYNYEGTIRGDNNDGVYMGQGGSVYNDWDGSIWGNNNGVDIIGGEGSVVNYGTIYGNWDDGVYMGQGGSVYNDNSIEGYQNGVDITGGKGSVYNDSESTITGDNADGVYLGQGGGVTNYGTIWGNNNGVNISGGEGYVYNDGAIYGGIISVGSVKSSGRSIIAGSSSDGVHMSAGGSVYNDWGGYIEGYDNGVNITGGKGYVYNEYDGYIYGDNADGVYMGAGGNVDNYGTISGFGNGVEIIGGTGSVYNDGYIYGGVNSMVPVVVSSGRSTTDGSSSDGVHMEAGGSVDNYGTISGLDNGVYITGGEGNVYNEGYIYGGVTNNTVYSSARLITIKVGSDGVFMGNGGNVANEYGTIQGSANGVEITGGEGSVYNYEGYIYGGVSLDSTESSRSIAFSSGLDGIYLGAGGSINNDYSAYSVDNEYGTIEGYNNGVNINGGSGSVYNYDGTITGDNADGVTMAAGGSVYNDWGGTIYGYEYGVEVAGGAGYVTNYGTIQGDIHDGVRLRAGGSVYNGWGGRIEGFTQGVKITGGPGYVYNAGTIIGDNGTAILLGSSHNNTVVLDTGSSVIGNIVGGSGINTDAAFLWGNGSYSDDFLNFETLTVQGDWSSSGWNLSGNNIFSTNTTVESGLLRINGSLTTPLVTVVDTTGGLGGTGTVFGIVDNHGYFAPGNSIGTVTIMGSMTNWGDYNVQVDNAGNSDRILVSDTATINSGYVYVQPDHTQIYGSNTVYTILTATNGVAGTYDGVSITALFLTASLQYDENNVFLTLDRIKFITVANTYNQKAVAGALDGIVDSPGAMTNLVTDFFWLPSPSIARKSLDSLSGEIHGTMGMLDVQQQDAFNNSIALRTGRMSAGGENGGYAASYKPVQLASAGSTMPPMQQAETVNPLDIWLQGFGSFGHLDGDGNALGGDYTISGLSGGLDYRLCPQMLIGLGVGYSHNDADVGGPGANGKVDAIQFAGYGGYVNGPWHMDGILSYGFLHTDTKRFINVGPIYQEADGKYDGGVLSLSGEGGYAFVFDWLTVEPTIGLDYAHLWQDSFSETGIATDGNNYGLNVKNVNMDSFRSALGVRLAAQFGKKDGVQFIPALRAVWEHEFLDRYADLNASFVGGSGDFNVRGVELGADSGVLGAGLTVAFNKMIQGFVNYDANLNERLNSSTISGGLSISW